jgi:hypothetical protein
MAAPQGVECRQGTRRRPKLPETIHAPAAHHLDYQLYELYLQRGGEPIRPRDERPAVEKSF